MPKLPHLGLLFIASIFAFSAGAVTVVQCIDADGNSSFRDKCPPGSHKKGEKRLTGLGGRDPGSLDAITAAQPVAVYTAKACDACDLVRNALSKRGIPFTEKAVEGNIALQQELSGLAGSLTVPTVTIGDRVLTGYSSDAITAALDDAGYPAQAGAPSSPSSPPTPAADEEGSADASSADDATDATATNDGESYDPDSDDN